MVRPLLFVGGLSLLLGLALFSGCHHPTDSNLIILHTGRLMGNAYPLSAKKVAPLQYYPYLAGYLKKVRAEAAAQGQQVLLIDSGDSLCGSYAAQVTHSENMLTLFKALQYDAIFLGNLDSAVAPELIARLQPIPVLTPFVNAEQQAALPGTTVMQRIKKGDLAIDLVANFYGQTNPAEFPERFPSFYGRDPQRRVQPFRDYAGLFQHRPQPKPNLTLLNWFKFESEAQPPVWLKAFAPGEVDAVLAHRIYASNVKETWGAGTFPNWPVAVSENILRQNRGFTLARLDLRLHPGSAPQVIHQELVQLTANTAPADEAIVAQLETFSGALEKANLTVAKLTTNYSKEEVLQLYLTALSQLPGVNTVLYSPESIRSEWNAGELRASHIYEALPWDQPLFLLELTTAQWQTLQGNPRLCLLEKNNVGSGSRRVVTSAFFAALIRQKLQLSPEALKAVDTVAEFDFFTAYLARQHFSGGPLALPTGWTYRPAL